MPLTRVRYRFVGETPLAFRVVVALAFLNMALFVGLNVTRRHWGAPGFDFGRGVAAALAAAASWSFAAHFVLVGAGFLVAFLYCDRLERVSVPRPGERPAMPLEVAVAATMAPAACGFVGGILAGAVYGQVGRGWGAAAAVAGVAAAVWVTGRMIRSFPGAPPSPKGWMAIRIWSVAVAAAVIAGMISTFAR